jgi:hypothetical protein
MSSLPQIARTSDPITSHMAAQDVTDSGARGCHIARVTDAVQRAPGRTSAELAIICGLERHEAARRTSDAERVGAIRKGEPVKCTVSGRLAVTWWKA